jgi:hypothetical protein
MDAHFFYWVVVMRGLYSVLAMALLCVSTCAQERMNVTVSDVTYLEAATAEVVPQETGVVIISEGLKAGQKYAAKLRVANQDDDYIEVFPEKNPFPPQVLKPYKPGEYLIPGARGEKFNVSVRIKTGRPVWLVVIIGGEGGSEEPPPVEPTPTDYEELRKASLNEALKTRDQKTAKALAEAWRKVATTVSVDKSLAEAVKAAKLAREQVLLNRDGDVNWNNYLTAVDGEIASLKITGTAEYLKVLAVLAGSLDDASAKFDEQQRVTGGR